MRKVVYIVPGFLSKPTEKPYKMIGKYFSKCGFDVVPVSISWDKKAEFTAMSLYVNDFFKNFNEYNKKGDQVYILGFSYGAMIAYIFAASIKVNTLVLCSMSPSFAEDLPRWYSSWKKHFRNVKKSTNKTYSAKTLGKKVKAKVVAIVGDLEPLQVLWRAAESVFYAKKGNLVVSHNVGHKLEHRKYLQTLKEVIANLCQKRP